MRTPTLSAFLFLLILSGCGTKGGGQPVPPLPSDFQPGATIPGWVHSEPGNGRGEVDALATHSNGRWSVIFSRPIPTRPKDQWFSLAVFDDGLAHSGINRLRLTSDLSATPGGNTVVARRVPNGAIVPDGTMNPGEWPGIGTAFLQATSQSNLPAGKWPTMGNLSLQADAAYDDAYIYLAFRWTDPSGTESHRGPIRQWDGIQWFKRPHRANDLNDDGILGFGEPLTISAEQEDEDRLALFFPIEDANASFGPGAVGCAASCHQNNQLDPLGAEAVHAWLNLGDVTDVWHWRAAATQPGRRAADSRLLAANPNLGLSGGGSGFSADAGASSFEVVDDFTPAWMFGSPVSGFQPLVSSALTFNSGADPGYPVLAAVASNAAPFSVSNFNATGSPPTTWFSGGGAFLNNYLPAYAQVPPSESAADLEVGSSHFFGDWTVEFRRRRVTVDSLGRPRPDDAIFEDDADFQRQAFAAMSAATGLPFAISITDRASGHGVRETEYRGPFVLSRDPSLAGQSLQNDVYLVDYGAAFAPNLAADFSDTTLTAPTPSLGQDRGLELKAGTDGGQKLYLLASWADPSADRAPDQWEWNGFHWSQSGGEDQFRILFAGSIPRQDFMTTSCALLCHVSSGGPTGAAYPNFATNAASEFGDLWHWRAGRGGFLSVADDAHVDRSLNNLVEGSGAIALHGDSGRAPFTANFVTSQAWPVYMAMSDPNAGAPAIALGASSLPSAIPFIDALGNLPPPPPSGGGVSFSTQVLPIFQSRCTVCHPPFAGLNLASYAAVIAGSSQGPVILPGNPSGSLLVKRIRGILPPQMPLGGNPLTEVQIQLIEAWIASGAPNN